MNRLKFAYYNFKTNFKFSYIIAIFMPLIFLALMACMVFLEYNAFMTGLFAALLLIQVLYLVYSVIKKHSMKKSFVFILVICIMLSATVFVTFLRQTVLHAGRGTSGTFTEDSRSFFSAVTWHHEDSDDFSRKLEFQAPPDNEYYYLDLSNTTSGDQLAITFTITCNLKLSELTVGYARSNTPYQLENGFRFVRNDSTSTFTEGTHEINGVVSTVWSQAFTYNEINNDLGNGWEFLFCFAINGLIDETWVGSNYISYLWLEFDADITADTIPIDPKQTGVTYNMIPLRYAVSDSWWLISLSIGVVWLIVFLLALSTQNAQTMMMMQTILIAISVLCLFVFIANELNAKWVKDLPSFLRGLGNFLAVAVAAVRWIVSVGGIVIVTTILSVFLDKLITNMKGNMTLGMPKSSKQKPDCYPAT